MQFTQEKYGGTPCRSETVTGPDSKSTESESYDIGNASARC